MRLGDGRGERIVGWLFEVGGVENGYWRSMKGLMVGRGMYLLVLVLGVLRVDEIEGHPVWCTQGLD